MTDSIQPRFRAPAGWPLARSDENGFRIIVSFLPGDTGAQDFIQLMHDVNLIERVTLRDVSGFRDFDPLDQDLIARLPLIYVGYTDEQGGSHSFTTQNLSMDELRACFEKGEEMRG